LSLPPFEGYKGPSIKDSGPRLADARRLVVDNRGNAGTVDDEVKSLTNPDGVTQGLLNGENLVEE
jgi:hypothetical protein